MTRIMGYNEMASGPSARNTALLMIYLSLFLLVVGDRLIVMVVSSLEPGYDVRRWIERTKIIYQ